MSTFTFCSILILILLYCYVPSLFLFAGRNLHSYFKLTEGSLILTCKDKGKAVPLQAWRGPEGSRKLRFPDLMTTAQDGGKVVSLTHRLPSPPGNAPGAIGRILCQ